MSVMSCGRKGCESILCDRYSSTYGYICNSCFSELVETGPNTRVDKFMCAPKEDVYSVPENSFKRYSDIFRS